METSFNGLGKNANGTDKEYDDLDSFHYEDRSRDEDPEDREIRMALEDGDYSALEGLDEDERLEYEKKFGKLAIKAFKAIDGEADDYDDDEEAAVEIADEKPEVDEE